VTVTVLSIFLVKMQELKGVSHLELKLPID
jgi:hypothetical protein